MKASRLLTVALLSAAFATPAFANYFSNPDLGMRANVGSAPNPTPADLRGDHNLPHMTVARLHTQPHLVQIATSLPRLYSTDANENAPAPRMSAMTKPDSDGGFFSWLWDWSTPSTEMSAPAPAPMMKAPAPVMKAPTPMMS